MAAIFYFQHTHDAPQTPESAWEGASPLPTPHPLVACCASILRWLPSSERHAIITLLLKKPGLDTSDVAKYRPVSNLTFISKVVERAVAMQLDGYLQSNSLVTTLLACVQEETFDRNGHVTRHVGFSDGS